MSYAAQMVMTAPVTKDLISQSAEGPDMTVAHRHHVD
jgi:hypothetical protein